MLRWSRQCSSGSFNVVQGCVAVVYLSCTMLWHGLGSDTSHNQTLPRWVKTAPLHGLVNLIVILEVIKAVENNVCSMMAAFIQRITPCFITNMRERLCVSKGGSSDCQATFRPGINIHPKWSGHKWTVLSAVVNTCKTHLLIWSLGTHSEVVYDACDNVPPATLKDCLQNWRPR